MKVFALIILFVFQVRGQEPAVQTTSEPAPSTKPEKTVEPGIQWNGDFRIRQQSETKSTDQQRVVQRLQVKLTGLAQVQEDLKFTLRFLTGKDSISGNQTMGDSKNAPMARRDFGLDLAFFDYQAHSTVNIFGGKMPQPFYFAGKSQIILDHDITPEGFAAKVKVPTTDMIDSYLNLGSFWIRENYDDSVSGQGIDQADTLLTGGQLGVLGHSDPWYFTLNAGLFAYSAVKDRAISQLGATSADKVRGNTQYTVGTTNYFSYEYEMQEISGDLKYKEKDWQVGLFALQVRNKGASEMNTANSVGVFGNLRDWTVSLASEEVQRDAVFSIFTDSDFAGGETSSKGLIMSLAYKLNKKVQIAYTAFSCKTAIDTSNNSYQRSHLDLSMAF